VAAGGGGPRSCATPRTPPRLTYERPLEPVLSVRQRVCTFLSWFRKRNFNGIHAPAPPKREGGLGETWRTAHPPSRGRRQPFDSDCRRRANGPGRVQGEACSFDVYWKLHARVGQSHSGLDMQDIKEIDGPRPHSRVSFSALRLCRASMQEHDAEFCWTCAIEPFASGCASHP
jgi:hypothetical protein